MPKCRLIYKSLADLEILGTDELMELVSGSAKRNRSRRITGLLALAGDQFLQVLEGPSAAVNALYTKIVADPRHHHVELLSYSEISGACFSDWSMQIVDLADLPMRSRKLFLSRYPSRDGEIVLPRSLPEIYAFLLDARAAGREFA